MHLPGAFRSYPRPSSPPGAKAFTVCSLKLDQNQSEAPKRLADFRSRLDFAETGERLPTRHCVLAKALQCGPLAGAGPQSRLGLHGSEACSLRLDPESYSVVKVRLRNTAPRLCRAGGSNGAL